MSNGTAYKLDAILANQVQLARLIQLNHTGFMAVTNGEKRTCMELMAATAERVERTSNNAIDSINKEELRCR